MGSSGGHLDYLDANEISLSANVVGHNWMLDKPREPNGYGRLCGTRRRPLLALHLAPKADTRMRSSPVKTPIGKPREVSTNQELS